MGKDLNWTFTKEDILRANKHMIVCSTSLVFRKKQIKIPMGYCYIRRAKTKQNQHFQMLMVMQSNWNSSFSGKQFDHSYKVTHARII